MAKRKLTLIFIILILFLIAMAIYSAIVFQETTTETMKWQTVYFRITNETKVFGIGIFLSILVYTILRNRISKTRQNAK